MEEHNGKTIIGSRKNISFRYLARSHLTTSFSALKAACQVELKTNNLPFIFRICSGDQTLCKAYNISDDEKLEMFL